MKLYLIQCDIDGSLVILRKEDLICDRKTVKVGDTVAYQCGEKKYKAKILKASDDVKILKDEIKKVREEDKKKRKEAAAAAVKSTEHLVLNPKRKTRSQSPKWIGKKMKLDESTGSVADDSANQSLLSDDDGSKKKDINEVSNSKDDDALSDNSAVDGQEFQKDVERKKVARDVAAGKGKTTNKHLNEPSTSKNVDVLDVPKSEKKQKPTQGKDKIENLIEESDSEDDDEDQLFGNNCGEKMKSLGNNVFCKFSAYKVAKNQKTQATAVARNLMVGVFKSEVLLEATVTGQSSRSLRHGQQAKKMIRLNDRAKNAIIQYSLNLAKEKNWPKTPHNTDEGKIRDSMAQKLVEIRAQKEKNNAARQTQEVQNAEDNQEALNNQVAPHDQGAQGDQINDGDADKEQNIE